jgi:hypothetical protein
MIKDLPEFAGYRATAIEKRAILQDLHEEEKAAKTFDKQAEISQKIKKLSSEVGVVESLILTELEEEGA